jgi:hypothetical protein
MTINYTTPRSTTVRVVARLQDKTATLEWYLTRLGSRHYFVLELDIASMFPVKNRFIFKSPYTLPTREALIKKAPAGTSVPFFKEKSVAANARVYKAMITSVIAGVKRADGIVAAQTSPDGHADIEVPDFMPPLWFGMREGLPQLPFPETKPVAREGAIDIMPTLLPPPVSNGHGKGASLIDIIDAHAMPVRTYEEGLQDAIVVLNDMTKELAEEGVGASEARAKLLSGYAAMIDMAANRILALRVKSVAEITVDTRIAKLTR